MTSPFFSRGPIRNACVARGTAPVPGVGPIYTVPDGYVLLLKSILTHNPNASTLDFTWTVSAPGGPTLYLHRLPTLASGYPDLFQTSIALNGGDQIGFYPQYAGSAYWVSGALLPWFPAPTSLLPGLSAQRTSVQEAVEQLSESQFPPDLPVSWQPTHLGQTPSA